MTDLPSFNADMSWAYRGACVGHKYPELWFPVEDTTGVGYDLARKICSSCQVLEQCQKHGIEHERHGMWGGLTAKQRREARISGKVPPIGRKKYRGDRGIGKRKPPGAQPRLTPEQVAEIQSSAETNAALARRFGCSKETVRYAKLRKGAYALPEENVKLTPDPTGDPRARRTSVGGKISAQGDATTSPAPEPPRKQVSP